MDEVIKLPAFSMARLLSWRRKLYDAGRPLLGATLSGDPFKELCRGVLARANRVRGETLVDSLPDLAGRELTPPLWAAVCWRLAANIDALRAGVPAGPWLGQPGPEWCPVQIESVVKRRRAYDNAPGGQVSFRILAGRPAGLQTERFWTWRFMRHVKYLLGFSRWNEPPDEDAPADGARVRNLPLQDATELTRLRLWCLFTPAASAPGAPGFEQVHNSAGFRTGWNRDILRARTHFDPPCPRSYSHPCHVCPVGFKECLAGCHRETYELRHCQACGKDAWHDPAAGAAATCIVCAAVSQ